MHESCGRRPISYRIYIMSIYNAQIINFVLIIGPFEYQLKLIKGNWSTKEWLRSLWINSRPMVNVLHFFSQYFVNMTCICTYMCGNINDVKLTSQCLKPLVVKQNDAKAIGITSIAIKGYFLSHPSCDRMQLDLPLVRKMFMVTAGTQAKVLNFIH